MQQLMKLREERESSEKMNSALEEERRLKLDQMMRLSMLLAETNYINAAIQKHNQTKIIIKNKMKIKAEEIKIQQKYCYEKEQSLKGRIDYLNLFNQKFQDEYDACQKKHQTINIRETVVRGIKRLFLLQLCTVFFEKENQRLFYGLHKLKNLQQLSLQDEDQLACALGYLGLLINYIARIKGVYLKYQFNFRGSRSTIQDGEIVITRINIVIFILVKAILFSYDNLYVVMDELGIAKQWRNQNINVIVGKIGEMLWVDA
ncbi:hypothetical protein pb186bvf_010562 [Paramecium bursaria]